MYKRQFYQIAGSNRIEKNRFASENRIESNRNFFCPNWNALVYSWLMCRRIATIGLSAAATTDLNPHTGSDPKPWLFSHYFCANRTPFTAGHKHRKWHLFVDTSTPSYLRLLIKDRQHDRNLRSTTTALCQPFTTTTFAKRAFRCSAPAVWNSLPQTVLRSDCCSF